MSNTLVIKNSSVIGHVPVGADLVEAELAVNTADKKLFTKDAQGNVVEIGMEVNSQTVEAALGFVPANQATTYTKNETNSAIQAVVGAAPEALNTLAEITAQLALDESATASIVTLVGTKAPLASPTFTGTVSGVSKAMVGLDSVDNTTDANKPLSTADIAALALKADKSYVDTQATTKASSSDVSTSLALKADKTYVDTALSSMGSSSGSLTHDFAVQNLAVSGNILPAVTGVSTIGSPTDKFAAVYTKELHIDANTLYVDGIPVIGSSANTIQITADLNQGLRLATTGSGQLILDSQTATTVQTNGLNADVLIQAGGSGSLARITSGTQVVLTAPIINIQGSESISGDLTVAGNMTVNGTTTAVNTANMTVKDNIVTVNKGEAGSGVSLRYSGFEVDRGDLARQRLVWDETVGKWVAGQTSQEVALATEPFVTAAISASTSSITVSSLGLGNVSNTSDANKPVSTAQAIAIALKASSTDLSALQTALQALITEEVNRALAAEATKASIASLSAVATSGSYNDLTNKPSNSGATWASFQ